MEQGPQVGDDEFIHVAWQRWDNKEQICVPLPPFKPRIKGSDINVEQALSFEDVAHACEHLIQSGLLSHPIFKSLMPILAEDPQAYSAWLPEIAYTAQLPTEALDRFAACVDQAARAVERAFPHRELPEFILLASEVAPAYQRSLAWMTPDEERPVLVLEKISPMPADELTPVLVHELIHTLQPRVNRYMTDFTRVQREGMSPGRQILHQISLMTMMAEEIATEVMTMQIWPSEPRRSGYLPMINGFVQALSTHKNCNQAEAWQALQAWSRDCVLLDPELRVESLFSCFDLNIRDERVTRAWIESGVDLGDYFHAMMDASQQQIGQRIANGREMGEELVRLAEYVSLEIDAQAPGKPRLSSAMPTPRLPPEGSAISQTTDHQH